jgi:AraC family mar-sox-rob regulon transcriptional activator
MHSTATTSASPVRYRHRETEPQGFSLSPTTHRVMQMLMTGDLARLRADSVAETLGISATTLRRRLRADHTSYQFLLDRARQYRCERSLQSRWLPGKCMADELGYLEINSFYRAFRRWTGITYSEYKLQREGRREAPLSFRRQTDAEGLSSRAGQAPSK